jgi:hypothetical protein
VLLQKEGNLKKNYTTGLAAVSHARCPCFDGAIGTAIEFAVSFYPMTDNAASAVTAGWGQRSNRAFKTVEDMFFSGHDHLKGLVVVIATPFAYSHLHSSPWILRGKQPLTVHALRELLDNK